MDIRENLLYTKEHEWVKIEGKKAIIGISDYAQHSLGDITFIDLPKVAAKVDQFKFCATVESVKAASDVFSPLSGTVLSVNSELSTHPELVNQYPYEKGFFFSIEIKDEAEKKNLMTAQDYKKYVEGLS